ncbi:MAG TPA: class I SAM-dependent methyltransferase [Caldilinea sp.]|nr:class I SAM-dependent methyltransferase [Caldilinea sp.]
MTNELQPFDTQRSSRHGDRRSPETARDLEAAAFLVSPEGAAALVALEETDLGDARTLEILTHLRRTLPPDLAGAALTQARLRRRAVAKFPAANRMFFTAEALEQASGWEPALHRAAQIHAAAPPGPVLDLGCGIGGDLIALAQSRPVVAYELDPVRARFAVANAAALGLADRVTVHAADWTAARRAGQLPAAAAAFADPARRSEGRRLFSLHTMQPPLAELLMLAGEVPALAVKVMPGVEMDEVPPQCSVEFVSHAGTCKEAVLWFGRGDAPARWATVHQAGGWLTLADDGRTPPSGDVSPGMVLYEPDPAVIRAGALAPLCERVGGHLLDPEIAYIVAGAYRPEPLAQAFAIDEVHPFSLKALNRRLRALEVGTVELLKRGFPQEPETLRPRLRLVKGGGAAAVILTQQGGRHIMLIGRRLARFGAPSQEEGDSGDER